MHRYGVIVREFTETPSPAAVITAIRPLVAPMLAIVETGISIVVPLPEVTETVLFLQNFTEIAPVKPVPVIVNVPPPAREIVVVESPVMEGA